MAVTIHNPDRYMSDLRTIVAQGRKRIGLLIGAGAAAGLLAKDGGGPLIPAIDGLTDQALAALQGQSAATIAALKPKLPTPNIEAILSRIRSLARLIGADLIDGLDGPGYTALANSICAEIGKIVDVRLPTAENPFSQVVSWIVGADRDHPIEIFTTNYDLLFEEALEAVRAPYFDGFAGGWRPFFDAVTVASNDLPPRWTRLWKLHGSLGWQANPKGEVIRTGASSATHLIFPEYLKYDQIQKAPYSALFDRLQTFLTTDDTLLITCGFSFADAHVSAKIEEGLAANPSASVFAFQFRNMDQEPAARELGHRRPNFSVYARDQAMINGVIGDWRVGDPPSKDWEAIRASYWSQNGGNAEMILGDFTSLARFLALSRSGQALSPSQDAVPAAPAPDLVE